MSIRFLKTPEAAVPTSSGPSLFVDTDGTPKVKGLDGVVTELFVPAEDNAVLSTGELPAAADAVALFGKDYDGVVELEIRQGTSPSVRFTQGAGLVPGSGSFITSFGGVATQQTADITLAIPATAGPQVHPLAGITLAPPPGVWCVYHCHIESMGINQGYQAGAPTGPYTNLRGLVISGDFSLVFNAVNSTPDVRHANPGVAIQATIALLLTDDLFPQVYEAGGTGYVVGSAGELSLEITKTGTEKYWSVLRVTISPPFIIPGP